VNKLMRQFLLLTGVGSLAFSLACGGGSNNGGGGFGSGGGTGSFSNASLNGQYAYQIRGYSLQSTSPFREAGVFTADGSGHITAGKDDFASGGSPSLDASTTGSYQVFSDGTGTILFNFGSGSTASFAITLVSPSKFYMVETDTTSSLFAPVSSGVAQKQDTTAFSATPIGTFILRMHTSTNPQSVIDSTSSVGAFTISGGAVTGTMDRNTFPAFTSSTITGSLNSPDATNGRGSGTFTDGSTATTTTFQYYIVDSSHLLFFTIDTATIGTGQAEKQTGGPFTTASFTGPYAFSTTGDTKGFFENTNTVGRFDADGNGGITAGVLDTVTDGVPSLNLPFTGTYTVAGTGKVAVTLNPTGGGSIQQVYWMVSPTRAFFVTNSGTSVEDGSLDTQTGSFSNSTLSGIYAFEMDGFDTSLSHTKERVGSINFNGSGSLTAAEVSNAFGASSTSGSLTGSYSVSSNGRVIGSVNSLSNNLVFYLVSGSDAYILQGDSGVAIGGKMSKQP
jgi:hypothetical protein